MRNAIPSGDPAKIKIIGKNQGYLGLAVLFDQTSCGIPTMKTAWEPSPEEIQKIVASGKIEVIFLGVPPLHPMNVEVSEPVTVQD